MEESEIINDIAYIKMKNRLPRFVLPVEVVNFSIEDSRLPIYRIGYGARNRRMARFYSSPQNAELINDWKNITYYDPMNAFGDSGGPVYVERNDEYYLVSIHSSVDSDFVTITGSYVPAFWDWIQREMDK